MDSSVMLGVPATPLLTVEEAASVLRIGRSLAYQLAREYDASGGVSGLPVVRFGGCLRVPRWALLELAHCGRGGAPLRRHRPDRRFHQCRGLGRCRLSVASP